VSQKDPGSGKNSSSIQRVNKHWIRIRNTGTNYLKEISNTMREKLGKPKKKLGYL
jgi:hypothetical protein